MIIHWWNLRDFADVQSDVREYGGANAVAESGRIYQRKTSSHVQKVNAEKGYRLYRRSNYHWLKVRKNARYPLVVNELPSSLLYLNKRGMTINLDGIDVSVKRNFMTTQTKKAKPKPQLNATILKDSKAPLITPQTHGNFVRVELGNESYVHVIYASGNSDCPILKQIHDTCYDEDSNAMENALDSIEPSAWECDHSAGGKYLPNGIGFMNVKRGKPFFLQTHKRPQSAPITTALSKIIGSVAVAILNYIPDVFKRNELLKCNNECFCFPPLSSQGYIGWFSHQVVIRRVGSGQNTQRRGCDKDNIARDHNIDVVGLHIDKGDISTEHPLIYIPRGGDKGRGGVLSDSVLIVGENDQGGRFVRIETNIEDTICIVVLNSAKQLHGLVEDSKKESGNAWSTRIIPFITKRVNNYMLKHPRERPIDDFNVTAV